MNRVTLLGNLGGDPEFSTLPSGTMLAKVSLATTERYLDKSTNEWKETTDWHRLVFWDSLAKTAADYLKKGSQILVEGRIKYGQYTGNDGVTRYTTDIQVRDMYMLGHRGEGNSNNGGGDFAGYQPTPPPSAKYNSPASSTGSAIADQLAGNLTPDGDDADIPF
ncbi:MAG: single-stranded DNA-binding protein [Ignavibacteria bacterium]|nr:single-stranded DNA-binding protein [Ignavibacteria bacterium]